METQKKTVKTREFNKEYNDKYGTKYSFIVTFEGDDTRYGYTSSKKEPNYFNPGEEQEFTVEQRPYKDKQGNDKVFNVVKPVKENNWNKGGGGSRYVFNLEDEKKKQKLNAIGYCMSYAKDLVIGDKIPEKELEAVAERLSNRMWELIDKVE